MFLIRKLNGSQKALISLYAILSIFLFISTGYAKDNVQKRLLILHSYHPSLSWTDSITKGMQEALIQIGESVQLHIDYMDARRYSDTEYRKNLEVLLLHKLADKKFDLVLLSDNDALNFMLAHRSRISTNAPIIFCGINNFTESAIAGHRGITGVAEEVSLHETLDTALKLHPETEEIIVIGRTILPADRANREAFLSLLQSYKQTVKFTFWDDLPANELRKRLHLIQSGSLVFINGLTSDETGRQLLYDETTRLIRESSNVPLYSLWDVYLGYGIIGGKLVSGYLQGKLAGELAVRVLRGDDPDKIPIIRREGANKFMFDYHELSRFGLSVKDLPDESEVINTPHSFYIVNKMYIWGGIASLLIFSCIIALFGITILARKRAEEAAQQLAKEKSIMAEIGRIISSTLDIDEVYVRFADETRKLIPFNGIAINMINYKEGIVTVPYVSGIGVPGCQPGDVLPLEGSVTGMVAHTRSSLIIQMKDKNELQARFPTFLPAFGVGVRTVIVVPLISKDQVIGAIHFRSAKPNAYSEQDLKLAEGIASQIAGAIANAQLFAERNQAKEAFRESQQRLKIILQGLPIPTFVIGRDHRVVHWNKAMEELSEVKAEEAIGTKRPWKPFYGSLERPSMADLLVDELIEEIPQWYPGKHKKSELIEEAYEATDFFPLLPGGGKWLHFTAATIRDSSGNVVGAVETLQDITERKHAEEVLRQSEEKYRSILESITEGYYEVDLSGNFTFFNDSVCQLLGYTRQELMGMNNRQYSDPENAKKLYQAFHRVYITQESTRGFDWKVIKKGGEVRAVEASVSLIKDSKGQPTGFRGIVQDITERKRAEEALQESEKKYRSVIENIQDVFYRSDSRGCLIMGSPSGAEMFGYDTIDEMIGMPLDSFWPDSKNRERLLEKIRTTGSVKDFEAILKRKDGTTFNASLTTHFYCDDCGNFLGTEGIIRDITERTKAERELANTKILLQSAFEQTPVPMALVSAPGGVFLNVNRACVEVLGFEDEGNPIGQSLIGFNRSWQILDAEGRQVPWTEMPLALAFQGMTTQNRQFCVLRKDGKRRWIIVSAAPIYNEIGERIAAFQVFPDITELKQAVEALRESEEKFRNLVETTSDWIWETDAKGNYSYTSPRVRDLLGYEPNEVIGRKPFDFMPLDEAERLAAEFVRINAERRPFFNLENINLRKDGNRVILETSGVPRIDSQGNFLGYRGIDRNISERKRAEEERLKLEAQMREVQKLESLGVLAGGIAHDFNNLLMAILGNADLALLSLSSVSPARHNIDAIVKTSQRAADLCHQMLAYSGKGRFVLGRYDLSEIVQEMSHMLQVSVSKKATLRYRFAKGLPAVEADATQLRQVVMNLITNASDAIGDASGVIEVTSGVMDCDRAYLSESYLDDNLPEGRYVYLEVSDTGCGMGAETRSRIFEPFFTTKFMGRGLGLAAVLGIVRGHKGTIKVYSEPGKGTTIKILLPAVEWTPADRTQIAEQSTLPPSGGTVLLVDDDQSVLDVASSMLEHLGFTVITASNGQEGLEVFRARAAEIDCVLLDLTMPRLSGEEVFREMRRVRSDMRVILSSGYNEQDATQRFVGKGLAGFIQKPYTLAKLQEIMRRIFG
jgi:PAS domain S-box-containing protein